MAQHCGVQSDALGAVSTRVGERGSRATAVMSAARAQIAAKGPGWGEGVLGSGFAVGPHGFVHRLATVAAPVGATAAVLKNYDAQRLRYTCGRFAAIRAGLGLGYLIVGSGLVMGFSQGRFVFSMRGVDGDGAGVAAVTVREMN
jgi:hypothetical protein